MPCKEYDEIREEVDKLNPSFPSGSVKDCHIADLKRKMGYPVEVAPNRIDPNQVQEPCPSAYEPTLRKAIKKVLGNP